jgi:hypothetical protein
MTQDYFRALASEEPLRPAESAELASGTQLAGPAADVSKLVQLLEDAAVVEPSMLTAADTPVLLLQAALVELRLQEAELFSQRIEELGYLANVLIAGSSGRRPRPVEALEQAIAVCNTGLERALGADRALAGAVDLLERTSADQLFRRGDRG